MKPLASPPHQGPGHGLRHKAGKGADTAGQTAEPQQGVQTCHGVFVSLFASLFGGVGGWVFVVCSFSRLVAEGNAGTWVCLFWGTSLLRLADGELHFGGPALKNLTVLPGESRN